jgi:undecaprenyl diphosphate synthase
MENKLENLPKHIAIIPDANRRWAKDRGLPPWKGHEAGAENFEKIISYSLKKGIECLSIWGSSIDNLTKRPLEEKKALLDIYKRYFTKMLEGREIYENEVQVNFIGRWEEQFPDSLKQIIYRVIEKTKNYQKRILNFMLAYGGMDEMICAVERINAKYEKGIKITAEMIKENLMTAKIPAVDYMIRTGGEPHNSAGFMMWDVSDAQLYFSPEKFPDFTPEKFEEALEEFARRERRFGS